MYISVLAKGWKFSGKINNKLLSVRGKAGSLGWERDFFILCHW